MKYTLSDLFEFTKAIYKLDCHIHVFLDGKNNDSSSYIVPKKDYRNIGVQMSVGNVGEKIWIFEKNSCIVRLWVIGDVVTICHQKNGCDDPKYPWLKLPADTLIESIDHISFNQYTNTGTKDSVKNLIIKKLK